MNYYVKIFEMKVKCTIDTDRLTGDPRQESITVQY
jgi:hypothetical protein